MKKNKPILSIICLIGLSGILGSLSLSLITYIIIFLKGIVYFAEPNLFILILELNLMIVGFISLPIIIISTIKNVFFSDV